MNDTETQQTAAVTFEPILTAEQVAARLDLDPQTIYEFTRSRHRNPIPTLRAGKFLRFRWSAVENWMANAKPTPRKPYRRKKNKIERKKQAA
jgi:predicted DNA-binding transcriptional regulator AlpA